MISSKSLLKHLLFIGIILTIIVPVVSADDGNTPSKSESDKENQIKKNTKEDIAQQVEIKYSKNENTVVPSFETEEDMANWFISQSITKPEKVCKKEEKEMEKMSRKIIKKEKKECKKLRKAIKKGNYTSEENK
jgi:hypothetical protein